MHAADGAASADPALRSAARTASRGMVRAKARPAVFEVTVKNWHAVANWTWDAGDDVCGICRMPFDGFVSVLPYFAVPVPMHQMRICGSLAEVKASA